ncbi:MAG: SH3 domain-containing protein [Sideroxyarcus sp.]|nr:SH3 domain-containing protein [Sideroxyarcus sp.]
MLRLVLVLCGWLAGSAAAAAGFVSVAEPAILYDANSLKAKKLYVATRYLPLQQLVVLAGWVKARDATGKVFWIEKRNVSSKRYVVVTAREAIVRQSWSSSASLAFRATRQVGLEWLGNVGDWVQVRHRDGSAGYINRADVWGE